MSLYILHHLGIDDEMMHLMHLASFLLILMMSRVLIIQIAILRTLFYDHTNLAVMMMMHHHGRMQHAESCYS